MKDKKRLCAASGLLLASALVGWRSAPAPSYSMRVVAFTGVSSQELQMVITRTPRFVKVRYAHLDSVRSKLKQDPDNLTPDLLQQGLPDQERMARYTRAVERYKVFTQDSIRLPVKRAQPFVQLLDSVYEASPEVLEQKRVNGLRVSLDGTSVYFSIQAPGQAGRQVYAHSPRADSQPLLYRLLHESLQLYRKGHPDSFLTRRATSGY